MWIKYDSYQSELYVIKSITGSSAVTMRPRIPLIHPMLQQPFSTLELKPQHPPALIHLPQSPKIVNRHV